MTQLGIVQHYLLPGAWAAAVLKRVNITGASMGKLVMAAPRTLLATAAAVKVVAAAVAAAVATSCQYGRCAVPADHATRRPCGSRLSER